MRLITHLVKTDIRRLWALLVVWLALLALRGALLGANVSPADHATRELFGTLGNLVPKLEIMLLFVIVPLLVLADPLVGTTAFWLTRPISRQALFQSKTLFVAAVLILPAVLVNVIVFMANGLTLRDVALAVPETVMAQVSLVMVAAVLAAVTPGFGRYAIVGVAFAVALEGSEMVVQWARSYVDSASVMRRQLDFSLARSSFVATSLWIMVAGGIVVAHQYFTRKTARSIAAAALFAAAALAAQHLWAWDFLAPRLPESAAPPFDLSKVKVEMHGSINTNEEMAARGVPQKELWTSIDEEGVPTSYLLLPKRVRPHLQSADGTALETREPRENQLVIETHSNALDSALGGIPVINAGDAQTAVTTLFTMSEDAYHQYRDQPLSFWADIDFEAVKFAVAAEMPVTKGARFDHGSLRIMITGILRQPDGVDILLRERQPNLLLDRANRFSPMPQPHSYWPVYVLRNKKRKEAVMQNRDNGQWRSGPPLGEEPLVNRAVHLSFGPEPMCNRLIPTLNDEWLADAELVRLDPAPALSFWKRLAVKDLKLNGKSGSKEPPDVPEPKQGPLPEIDLPPNASKTQVKEYINSILLTTLRRKKFQEDDPQVAMLVKVGAQNLGALLEVRSGLKSSSNFEWGSGTQTAAYLDAAIKQLARPEDKDLIIRALPFDDQLAEIVVEKGFQADAREVLMTRLSHERDSLPIAWIKAVAALQDPATYPELRSYFIRCSNRKSTFAVIRMLPGFELVDAVAEAWKKAKYDDWGATWLCGIAAEYGHADALQKAADILRTTNRKDYLEETREVLKKLTPASGDDPALLAWFDANRDKLVFDQQSKKYIVKL
jgi:hypothetical protein